STADPQSGPQACAQSAWRTSYLGGLCTLFMRPARVLRSAILLKPSTLLRLHKLLKKQKYHMLFASKSGSRPGAPGPKQELIDAVVEMKQRNPRVENHCSGAWPGCLLGSSILAPVFMRFRGPAGPTGHLGLSSNCPADRVAVWR